MKTLSFAGEISKKCIDEDGEKTEIELCLNYIVDFAPSGKVFLTGKDS